MILEFLVFLIIFGFLGNHQQIRAFLKQIKKGKNIGEKIEDKYLIDLIKEKTGLKLEYIAVFDSEKPMGMMSGIPFKPHMILTKGLLKNFNKSELEYVVLHEAGHCLLWHVVKAIAMFIILAILGAGLIFQYHLSMIYSTLLAVIVAIIFNNLSRLLEYETDNFAVSKITDPRGIISATEKFKNYYGDRKTFWKQLLYRLFYLGVPYNERIKIAQKEIKRRNETQREISEREYRS